MSERIEINLEDGKYTYLYHDGDQSALRFNEEWRSLTGDQFVYAMACRIRALEAELAASRAQSAQLAEAGEGMIEMLDFWRKAYPSVFGEGGGAVVSPQMSAKYQEARTALAAWQQGDK
jgi:hypothetical protein